MTWLLAAGGIVASVLWLGALLSLLQRYPLMDTVLRVQIAILATMALVLGIQVWRLFQ